MTQLIDALLALTDRCPEGRERHFAFNSINDIISSKHTFDREYHLPRAQCEKLVDAIIADRDGSYRPDAHLAIDVHAGFTDADSRRMAESAANPAIRQFVWRHMSHTLDELLPAYREAVQNGWEDIQSSVYDRLRKLESGDAAVLMDFVRGTDNLTIREICAVRLVQDDMDGVEGIEAMRDEAVEAYIREEGLKGYTPNTITRPDNFRREIAKVREQGYAFDDEEHEQGIFCVSAPILNTYGETVAAMSVSTPVFRLDKAAVEETVNNVCASCREVSAILGYDPE